MAELFTRNFKRIKEVYDDFTKEIDKQNPDKRLLMIDRSYQRRKVWTDEDKVRLIETILLKLVIPEVFFWAESIDADTGETITHIVDGQQRIMSIVEFISGVFSLNKKYLLDSSIQKRCGDMGFKELSQEDKREIWDYRLSIVEMDKSFSKKEIKNMFKRLNLTDYSLNKQEKFHSEESRFGEMAEALAGLDFWKKYKLFSSSDIKRMGDVTYCCSIYILANEWIIEQTNETKINDYYRDYANYFDEDKNLYNKIIAGIDIIEQLCDKTTLSFISKKTQLYTLFSVAFKLIADGIELRMEIFERFKLFVSAYNLFRNEYNIDFSDNAYLGEINNKINKYKLASSEGINKHQNRMIRFKILYNICIEMQDDIKDYLRKLAQIYKDEKNSDVSYEALDVEDIDDVEKML